MYEFQCSRTGKSRSASADGPCESCPPSRDASRVNGSIVTTPAAKRAGLISTVACSSAARDSDAMVERSARSAIAASFAKPSFMRVR